MYLQLSAGFVGADTFHFGYAGSMLAANTFGYDILFICINFWGLLNFRDVIDIPSDIFCFALFYRSMVVIGSAFSAAIHRRHLMVWAVFAPKLIFETIFYVVYSLVYTMILAII